MQAGTDATELLSRVRRDLAVVSEQQRVGARLMEKARAHAQNLGMKRLLLGVYAENKPAIAFYERLGYERTSVRLALIGNDGPTGGYYYFDQVLPW